MAKICESLLSKDIKFDCKDQSTRGLEADGVIINRRDIDFSKTQFDDVNKNIIKQLILKSGKKAYEIVQLGNTPYTGTKSDLVVGTYRNTWTHELPLAVLSNTPDTCENIIDGLANGSFVIILKNKSKGADGKAEYQVYGYTQGLNASAGSNDKYSEELDGGWLITLQEVGAPQAALFFFNTDSETTEQAFNSLKTDAA